MAQIGTFLEMIQVGKLGPNWDLLEKNQVRKFGQYWDISRENLVTKKKQFKSQEIRLILGPFRDDSDKKIGQNWDLLEMIQVRKLRQNWDLYWGRFVIFKSRNKAQIGTFFQMIQVRNLGPF